MRQLLISEIFPPRTGGSGRWFWEIYGRLSRDDFFVAPGQTELPAEEIDSHEMILARVPLTFSEWGIRSFSTLRDYWRTARLIARLVQKHRIDRIHCGRMLPEGWIAWMLKKWRGTPYLCYVHGEETSYGVHSRELGWMMRRVLKGSDFLVANSRNTASILQKEWGVPEDKIRILHPGADTDRFFPVSQDRAIRQKLGWEDKLVVFTAGRLQQRKGHDMLLRAMPAIIAVVPNAVYAIVGEGDERESIEGLIEELQLQEHVQLLGELQDGPLIECYQQCDLFVLPNREVDGDIEGFGIVLVEAQACGKPVIAGDSGGTSETMAIGDSGLVIDCTKPETIASNIINLLNAPERRQIMGEAGRAYVEENFAWPALSVAAAEVLSQKKR